MDIGREFGDNWRRGGEYLVAGVNAHAPLNESIEGEPPFIFYQVANDFEPLKGGGGMENVYNAQLRA